MMRIIVDNIIARILADDATKLLKQPLLANLDNRISFGWPALLAYLGCGEILSNLPAFDADKPLFQACLATLYASQEKEVLFHVYDHLFAENLNQIKALPQINAPFLLQAIRDQRAKASFVEAAKILSPALGVKETALILNPSQVMHDLILYLAWDRMCVCMARIFNHQSPDPKFIHGIAVMQDCLVESYQHIKQHGRTSPGIYRLLEALFFYHMREEHINNHSDAEWALLSRSFNALKADEELMDMAYIDDAVIMREKLGIEEENPACYLTLDSADIVNARLALTNFMLAKLTAEVPQWSYVLRPTQIVHLSL